MRLGEIISMPYLLICSSSASESDRKDPFHLPAAAITAQRSAILSLPLAVDEVGRDHLDAVFTHLLVERVRIRSERSVPPSSGGDNGAAVGHPESSACG